MPPDMSNPSEQSVIGLLGPITVDGRAVPGMRARRLLVALVLAGGRPVSTQRLIDEVWGDDAPKSPHAALHTQVSRLRPILGTSALVGDDGRYRLSGFTTDVEIVERALAQSDPDAAERYWRGDAGEDLGAQDELADRLRSNTSRLRGRVDDARAHRASRNGDHAVVAEIAQARIDDDPLDEPAHVLLMRTLAATGRTNEALAVFARLRRTLAEELGADPGPAASAVNAELLAAASGGALASSGSPVRRTQDRLCEVGLIGRESDLDALDALLVQRRVVTVQGPGGVGKTSIASTLGKRFADRGTSVYFVPLAAVRDGDDLIAAVAGGLGVGESDVRTSSVPRMVVSDLSERLGDALRGTDTLLILDNCEQVIDACASLVESLVAELPRLKVVVTSRSPLLIATEQVYPLPVLGTDGALSPGVELFVERARSVRPNAELDPVAVATLCAHLDGLPLAIELAAARIRVMSVDEIMAGLTERFALLRSADRLAPDRHRTLEAVIDWSWDLLDEPSRAALRRTCLFPDGFSFDAAATVTGTSGAALADALTALVDQSLLQVIESAGQTRYRMLEMVREFGEQRAELSGDVDAVTAAMTEWACAFCHGVRERYEQTPDYVLAAMVAVESENLVWVLRRAVTALEDGDASAGDIVTAVFPIVGLFWASRGLHAEVGVWGARAVRALPTPPPGLDDSSREAWELTVGIATAHLMPTGDTRGLGRGAFLLRRLHRPELTFEDPIEFLVTLMLVRKMPAVYRIVLRGLEPGRPERVRWVALSFRFNVRENIGDLDGALRDAEEVARLAGRSDFFAAAMTDMTTASLVGQRGEWARALKLYERSVERFRALGAENDSLQVGGYIIAARLLLGDFDGARAGLDELSNGWKPEDPTPQGNPEAISVMMVVTAEYQRMRGTASDADVADLFIRAADLLRTERAHATRDPGVMGMVTAAVAGLISVGAHERASSYVNELSDSVIAMNDGAGWIDVPQAAGVVFVLGVLQRCTTTDTRGARWMALGIRLGARHDYPALHELIADAQRLSGCSDEQWAELQAACADLPRRRALDEGIDILAERLGT
ncbi:BTAD domain-containing putative transcriptional regulator [Gordonia zhaorongruii]|uniref:BTAD domain-containing putative transcriptional regulator n=1 Tax=Gordonia zhaorongruii TaxID=2597659 RepID=UPI00118070BF|nr:BTAD domain-containing putative transcriptional regulator [Gordonia zhaorongruii]